MKRRYKVFWFIVGFLYGFLVLSRGFVGANTTIDALTNNIRVAHELNSLPNYAPLQALASRRAQEISVHFDHPTDWQPYFATLPSCARGIGENIAYRTTLAGFSTPEGFVEAWYESGPHRENMLGTWTYMASSMLVAADGRTYAVQEFLLGCGTTTTTVKPAPKPTPRQTTRPVITRPQPVKPRQTTAVPVLLPNTSVEYAHG